MFNGSLQDVSWRHCLDIKFKGEKPVVEDLPFSTGDTTAGLENEWQAVVVGKSEDVDIVRAIRESGYFRNLLRRAESGDAPGSQLRALEEWLLGRDVDVWENSWVRIPRRHLNRSAVALFENDTLEDKSREDSPRRTDLFRFVGGVADAAYIRIPISYLLKLALAQALDHDDAPAPARCAGQRLQDHFLNDNTSPETFSFHPIPLLGEQGMGKAAANECLKRFFLTQLLTGYANVDLGLKESGQRVMIYAAPHPPLRQKALNELISDSFYRDLFMSPCLSGWNRGEDKHHYMKLCHQVLSRSQLNAVAKLRDAGIIVNNLIVLPSVSNISLANNGVHISLGSRKLTRIMGDPSSAFRPEHEKYLGDLCIKITEHFLPLFVGLYTAAPYKLDFKDFHPEKLLGFLPHELDYSHLRMIWRRWKKKGRFKIAGQSLTPFGPVWLDRLISRLFVMKGDLVPDFRLLDYPVALLSSEECPALDGTLGNDARVKRDLAEMGVFDSGMTLYQLYRLRDYQQMGFSGFEGRHYSLFNDLHEDLAHAVDLQNLVTALAYKYALCGTYKHRDIPDGTTIESERRQMFFGAAIGIPSLYVRIGTANQFMTDIIKQAQGVRASKRYKGYYRVPLKEYRLALLRILRRDGADLIHGLGLEAALHNLEHRIIDPVSRSVAGKLISGILQRMGAKNADRLSGDDFNASAELYYRNDLRMSWYKQALSIIEESSELLLESQDAHPDLTSAFRSLMDGQSPRTFWAKREKDILKESLTPIEYQKVIAATVLIIQADTQRACDAARAPANTSHDERVPC